MRKIRKNTFVLVKYYSKLYNYKLNASKLTIKYWTDDCNVYFTWHIDLFSTQKCKRLPSAWSSACDSDFSQFEWILHQQQVCLFIDPTHSTMQQYKRTVVNWNEYEKARR